MHPYIKNIHRLFEESADEKIAVASKAYLRNQFEHFGIRTPLRRTICKEYMKKELPSYPDLKKITKEMWGLPQREFQYFAVELLAARKKEWEYKIITLFEYFISHKSWWDSVDHIASELTGPYFIYFPEQIKTVTSKWNQSDNIWLQRSSIMFQKAYRKATDKQLLASYILNLADSNEFFIQKAIGWSLREYSKTNPSWVKDFVKKNPISVFSKKEALKRIK
ncbi:MAG: DNA alkylation repair protein [Bacteroidetes bacterium]|nr:DNA alkylation repair protein [Bacteroidota bacterium]